MKKDDEGRDDVGRLRQLAAFEKFSDRDLERLVGAK